MQESAHSTSVHSGQTHAWYPSQALVSMYDTESKRPSFRSTQLRETDTRLSDTVWTKSRAGKKANRRNYLFFFLGVSLGLLGAAGIIVEGFLNTKQYKYCLVLEDNFDGPLDTSVWKHKIETGGFGNHEFEWTTDSVNNSFVSSMLLRKNAL